MVARPPYSSGSSLHYSYTMKNKISLALALLVLSALPSVSALPAFAGAKTQSANYDAMPVAQARQYLLMLINMDRQRNGLRPVALDFTATIAGQKHTDYLLSIGSHGHWEGDGSKPTARYNAAGGTDFVAENVARTRAGGYEMKPDPNARFTRMSMYELETMWMNSPGHRANILDKNRTHVGIGLSQPKVLAGVVAAQEFVNKYGNISKIPNRVYRGETISVSGSLYSGYAFQSISVEREDFPKRMTMGEMESSSSYTNGNEHVTALFPKGSSGSGFSERVEIARDWRPGMYYFIVWARDTRSNDHIPVSILSTLVI